MRARLMRRRTLLEARKARKRPETESAFYATAREAPMRRDSLVDTIAAAFGRRGGMA
jgi:hypothetical protein